MNRWITFLSACPYFMMLSKAPTACNWVPSTVTEDTLKEFATIGFLLEKNVMSYRAPDPDEERPQPEDGEVIIFTAHMNRGFSPPGSKFFRDVLQFSSFIHKILDPTLYPISAIFKFFVKYIFKKNQPWNFSGNIFIWTARMSSRTGPAWNLAESRFNAHEMPSFLMQSCQVTPRIGTRRGFTAKIPLRLTRIHCRVIVSCA